MSDDPGARVGRLEHSSVALAHDLARLPLVSVPAVAPLATMFVLGWMVYGRDERPASSSDDLVLLLVLVACVALGMMLLALAAIVADDRVRLDVHEHALVRYTRGASRRWRPWRPWPLVPPLESRHAEIARWPEILTVSVMPGRVSPTCRIVLKSRRELSFELSTRRRAETVSLTRSRIPKLHCPDGPAWRWPDGSTVWALDGIEVPPWVVRAPNPRRILDELTSAEQRRAGFAHYGWVRAVYHLGLEPVDEHPDPTVGTLYRLPPSLSDGPDGVNLLVVRNASPNPDGTYTRYGLTAPPSTRTAEEAQAALMRLTVQQYRAIQVHT